jgi:hypothetical protein
LAIAKSRKSPALVYSILLHVSILVLFGVIGFAVQVEPPFLLASSIDPSWEEVDQPTEVEVAPPELEAVELSETLETGDFDWDDLDLSSAAIGELGSIGSDAGFSDLMPSDVGSLMAGLGNGAGSPRATSFFGTASQGKRFVFVVDNSGSMQQGRMETTFFELLKCVDSMQPDQYFYVVFYSDQAYPMFHPEPADRLIPATGEHREKLAAWLETVELCTGGRLIEAMELASSLNPQVVYLLSDGAIHGAATMRFMTDDHDWPFAIHTLGMTVRNAEDAGKLQTIAAAHGGTFRAVEPSPELVQLARQRPIKYNSTAPGKIWGTKVRTRK